jgi:hypothetical protein
MKHFLLTIAVFVLSTAASAETITLIGPVVGAGGTEDYYRVPNSASIAPLSIVKRPIDGYRNLTLGAVTCSNALNLGSDTLSCDDGSTVTMNLFETYERHCRAGRCNSHWTLSGGTIERP